MTIGIITQARMSSTRLPGKVMRVAGGRTLLDHHLDRLLGAGLPVIVATTTDPVDDPIASLARGRGIDVFRGSEADVLNRYAGAAAHGRLDAIVRVTSDCPLIDPELVLEGVRRFTELGDSNAYVSNVVDRTYPRGFDFEVFSASALVEADRNAITPAEREHVTPYIRENRSGHAHAYSITRADDASQHRVTVDTTDDLALIRVLIEHHGAAMLDVDEIIRTLEANPDLVALNAHVEQKRLGE